MATIENAAELRKEIERLKKRSDHLEKEIRNDVSAIRENLRPENLILHTISSWTGIPLDKKEFFKNGFAVGLVLLVRKYLFKTETAIEGKIYSWTEKVIKSLTDFIQRHSKKD